jgi:hypothetical protein
MARARSPASSRLRNSSSRFFSRSSHSFRSNQSLLARIDACSSSPPPCCSRRFLGPSVVAALGDGHGFDRRIWIDRPGWFATSVLLSLIPAHLQFRFGSPVFVACRTGYSFLNELELRPAKEAEAGQFLVLGDIGLLGPSPPGPCPYGFQISIPASLPPMDHELRCPLTRGGHSTPLVDFLLYQLTSFVGCVPLLLLCSW